MKLDLFIYSTITSVVYIPTCLCVLISAIDFCRLMLSSFLVILHLKQDLVLSFIILNHNILLLTSHPTPIDILERKKSKKSTTQSLTPFKVCIYIYKTDMKCLGYGKFVRFLLEEFNIFIILP